MGQNLEKLLDELPKTELELDGQTYDIPVGQPLLRGLQYLEFKGHPIKVTRGPFCWNGECKSCVCDIEFEDQVKKDQRICRIRVRGPIKMTTINKNFSFKKSAVSASADLQDDDS